MNSSREGRNGRAALTHGRLAFAALILCNLFLAFGPWMVRLADVGPVAAAFWRVMLASPVLLLVGYHAQKRTVRPDRGLVVTILVGGFFFAADLAAWHAGILQTKLANATLFGNASSFLFPIYGFLLLRRWPRPIQAAALLLAAVGTALLLGSSSSLSTTHLVGDLLAMLAGLFYTFYLIAIDKARKTLAPIPVLALSTIAGTLPLLMFALLLGETVMPHNWAPLILLSLGSQLLGQGLLVYAIGHLRPLVVGLVFLTQPIVTAAIGWLVYGERLGPLEIGGAALICVAIVLIRTPARLESQHVATHLESDRRVG